MDDEHVRILKAVAFGFTLSQIANRTSICNPNGEIVPNVKQEAWAIVNAMLDLMPKDPT